MTYSNMVKNIVFHLGSNDIRRGATAADIKEKTQEMQKKYREKFPNARQHLTLIPPVVEGHVEANACLQRLATDSGSNLITNKPFLDRATGNLRANLTKGIHYNDWGCQSCPLPSRGR